MLHLEGGPARQCLLGCCIHFLLADDNLSMDDIPRDCDSGLDSTKLSAEIISQEARMLNYFPEEAPPPLQWKPPAWHVTVAPGWMNNEGSGAAKSKPLGPQQFVIQLANSFQLGAQLLVVLQPLLYLRPLFGGDAELPGASSGIADRQHPDAVALSSPTLRTTRR